MDGKRRTEEKEEAIQTLRTSIIKSISKYPAKNYLLSKLLWDDAEKCFPDAPFGWDIAEFYLDLESGRLFAETATYPNRFGACREGAYSLTPEEFHQKVTEHSLGELLLEFECQEDWDILFDDELKDAVSSATAKIKAKELEIESEEREKYSIRISNRFLNTYPAMNLSTIKLQLSQAYAVQNTTVIIKNDKYFLEYSRNSLLSLKTEHYSRELSMIESVWLEKNIESTLSNKDKSTWHSLPGGDKMDILIKGDYTGKNIIESSVEPIEKYYKLMYSLEKLAQYGSITVSSESVENDNDDEKTNIVSVDEK